MQSKATCAWLHLCLDVETHVCQTSTTYGVPFTWPSKTKSDFIFPLSCCFKGVGSSGSLVLAENIPLGACFLGFLQAPGLRAMGWQVLCAHASIQLRQVIAVLEEATTLPVFRFCPWVCTASCWAALKYWGSVFRAIQNLPVSFQFDCDCVVSRTHC